MKCYILIILSILFYPLVGMLHEQDEAEQHYDLDTSSHYFREIFSSLSVQERSFLIAHPKDERAEDIKDYIARVMNKAFQNRSAQLSPGQVGPELKEAIIAIQKKEN